MFLFRGGLGMKGFRILGFGDPKQRAGGFRGLGIQICWGFGV